MEQELKLHEAEYRFACIIWEHEPLSSGELAQLCRQQLNWQQKSSFASRRTRCMPRWSFQS